MDGQLQRRMDGRVGGQMMGSYKGKKQDGQIMQGSIKGNRKTNE